MNYMAGTLSPEQMAQMQMLSQALRGGGSGGQQSAFNPAKRNQVQDTGAFEMGAGGISALGGKLGGAIGNIGTAMNYGTTPFSQQTNMLQAQNAGF